MAAGGKIRVGIVGVSPNRGFASIAHIPALRLFRSSRSPQSARPGRILQKRLPGISEYRWRFPMLKCWRDIRMSIWSRSA